jgi:uncharacterized protein YggL (DUF469 family)
MVIDTLIQQKLTEMKKVLEKQSKIREFQEKRFLLQQSYQQNVKATTLQRNALKNLWLI